MTAAGIESVDTRTADFICLLWKVCVRADESIVFRFIKAR